MKSRGRRGDGGQEAPVVVTGPVTDDVRKAAAELLGHSLTQIAELQGIHLTGDLRFEIRQRTRILPTGEVVITLLCTPDECVTDLEPGVWN